MLPARHCQIDQEQTVIDVIFFPTLLLLDDLTRICVLYRKPSVSKIKAVPPDVPAITLAPDRVKATAVMKLPGAARSS